MENLVERVAHLHQIPSRFGEGRNAEHNRLLGHVDESVRIDRHVIRRDDEAILRPHVFVVRGARREKGDVRGEIFGLDP